MIHYFLLCLERRACTRFWLAALFGKDGTHIDLFSLRISVRRMVGYGQ
jgi:hypothetical protein